MDNWYDYDMSTHVLTPKDRVYLIQEVDAELTWKLQITTYYSADGDLHNPTFRWALLIE